MIHTPIHEQETTINIFRDEKIARIYTCDSTIITKLDKMVARSPEHYKLVKSIDGGKWYEMPKKLLSFRTGKRTLNDESDSDFDSALTE